jgi:hypothetical protein
MKKDPSHKGETIHEHEDDRKLESAVEEPRRGLSFRKDIYLYILLVVISTMSGVVVSLISSKLESDRWKQEISYSYRAELIKKRTELLERTISAFGSISNLKMYKDSAEYSMFEGRSGAKDNMQVRGQVNNIIDNVVKINEAQMELHKVITLDALYFGPRTRKALSLLSSEMMKTKPWWSIDESHLKLVLDAVSDELFDEM